MQKLSFISIILSMAFLPLNSLAVENCFPENNVKIPTGLKSFGGGGIAQFQFHQVIDQFERVWKPIVKEKYGKDLKVERLWDEARVNAHATRDDDNNPVIVINGGLARHRDMSPDSLLLIMCHELGHHYGGAPKNFRGKSTRRSWSSAEGQADYFASNKCMRKLIEENNDNKSVNFADKMTMSEIEKVCMSESCKRTSVAALALGRVFASLKYDWHPPKVNGKSKVVVDNTFYKHPEPQCRFDTFVAGLLCDEEKYSDFDNSDHSIGACIRDRGQPGARPLCWFSPESY
ncbi:MAG: hypothetical protein BM556_07860 [Bacteriovorax sp. MedPE-SWde]|nr:MAG: hypothetical protein BM556_07860 [Bacteriovorax sp. MedPE-SWde]